MEKYIYVFFFLAGLVVAFNGCLALAVCSFHLESFNLSLHQSKSDVYLHF